MALTFQFGVEVEAIVEPHNKGQPVRASINDPAQLRLWCDKLAAALRNRKGMDHRPLQAETELNLKRYRQKKNRHLQWWITWDGSLVSPTWPKHPGVPLEAVSPVLQTNKKWEDEIDAFWSAMRAVFHMPRRSSRCGSHVHVSPGRGHFHLPELKAIAFAVIWYNDEVQQILHRCRRECSFCRSNKAHSRELQGKNLGTIVKLINNVSDAASLVRLIQGWEDDDRRTLWNFHNVTKKPASSKSATGSVEFRGGRCLRGPVRTKRWITFAMAFVILAMEEFQQTLKSSYPRVSMDQFWGKLRNAAGRVSMKQYLPLKYTTMNDSSGPNLGDEDNDSDGNDDPIDPPNDRYVPQSAMNSPFGSDNEDN